MKTQKYHGKAKRINLIDIIGKEEEAVSIELRVEKALKGEGDLEMTRNPYYTPRGAGVPDETNIKSERLEIMREAIGKAQTKYWEEREKRESEDKMDGKESGPEINVPTAENSNNE